MKDVHFRKNFMINVDEVNNIMLSLTQLNNEPALCVHCNSPMCV